METICRFSSVCITFASIGGRPIRYLFQRLHAHMLQYIERAWPEATQSLCVSMISKLQPVLSGTVPLCGRLQQSPITCETPRGRYLPISRSFIEHIDAEVDRGGRGVWGGEEERVEVTWIGPVFHSFPGISRVIRSPSRTTFPLLTYVALQGIICKPHHCSAVSIRWHWKHRGNARNRPRPRFSGIDWSYVIDSSWTVSDALGIAIN